MAKGVTYFCNDIDGNLYTRYSERHTVAMYPYCVIFRGAGTAPASKSGTSYASRLDLASKQQAQRAKYHTKSEISKVRAYPGRHTAEPAAELAITAEQGR